MLKNKKAQIPVLLFVIFTIFIYATALFLFSQSSKTIDSEVEGIEIVSNVFAKRQILEQVVLQEVRDILQKKNLNEDSYLDQVYLNIKKTFVEDFPEFNTGEEYLSDFSKKVKQEDFDYELKNNELIFHFEDVIIKESFTDKQGNIVLEVSYTKDFQIIYTNEEGYSVGVK
jgi:hypothetical protein